MRAQVESVTKEDITCVAHNSAQLDGLLTVFHTERSTDSLSNVQNDLPILNDYDKKAITSLVSEFEARAPAMHQYSACLDSSTYALPRLRSITVHACWALRVAALMTCSCCRASDGGMP